MKKIIITIVLAFFIVPITNAQIKKPTVKVNVNKRQTQKPSGLLLKSSVKLKTLQDLNKLNIPVAQITKEKLNAKPTQSWKITPLKLKYGGLKLVRFKGDYGVDYWSWGTYGRGGFNKSVSDLENGKPEDPGHYILPFAIKFRATGGVEYRLKIKQRVILHTRTSNYLYIKKGNLISKIQMNGLEFNYIFKEPRSREIEISFSGVAILNNTNRQGFYPLRSEKIQIDRIN